MAELGNGGRSTAASAGAASTRPPASLQPDDLAGERPHALEHEASASSIVSSSATGSV